jgi:hypothetical protein
MKNSFHALLMMAALLAGATTADAQQTTDRSE